MEHKEKYPSMVTISGLSYMRLLHGDAKGPLQSYIHDVDYQYESLQLPEIIRLYSGDSRWTLPVGHSKMVLCGSAYRVASEPRELPDHG